MLPPKALGKDPPDLPVAATSPGRWLGAETLQSLPSSSHGCTCASPLLLVAQVIGFRVPLIQYDLPCVNYTHKDPVSK